MAVLLLGYCSYSSSEVIYSTTGNAAATGQQWVMQNIIPQYTGLAVNGVVYQYTTIKNPEDQMVVTVQNENAIDGGYIFRSRDDWSGQPGNTINRIVPIDYIDVQYWGDGSIEVEGAGQVTDPSVVYTYRYDDKCIDPQANPSCPGYTRTIPEMQETNLQLAGETFQDQLDREQVFRDEDQERQDFEKMKDKEKKKIRLTELEVMLGTFTLNDMQGPSEILHNQLEVMSVPPASYGIAMTDPGYEEQIRLKDSVLPDSRSVRRLSYSNDVLHNKMVEQQYKLGETK